MDRAGLACPGNATGGLGARLRALQASGGDRRVCGTPGKLRGAGRLWPRDDGDDGDVTTGRVLDQLLSSRWPTSLRTCWFLQEMGGDTTPGCCWSSTGPRKREHARIDHASVRSEGSN